MSEQQYIQSSKYVFSRIHPRTNSPRYSASEYKLWVKKARDDIRWTRHNLETKEYSGACFSSQQAAEKVLKAFLLSKQNPLRKIHDLAALLKACVAIDPAFNQIERLVKKLFPYYATTRYPFDDELFFFDKVKAQDAYDAALKIVDFVEK